MTVLQRGNPSEINSITHAFVGAISVLQEYKATKIDEKDESMEELKNGGTTEVPMKEKPSDATLKIAMEDAMATKMQGESKPNKGGRTIWVPKKNPKPFQYPKAKKKGFDTNSCHMSSSVFYDTGTLKSKEEKGEKGPNLGDKKKDDVGPKERAHKEGEPSAP